MEVEEFVRMNGYDRNEIYVANGIEALGQFVHSFLSAHVQSFGSLSKELDLTPAYS